ncbi:TVP38/TMEM64 family protein [Deferribacteraceae bacterium V6Fe1]|nr:TVP38/TMEM64 family protein [Deferribacteraceae bacterium V6Fe1]
MKKYIKPVFAVLIILLLIFAGKTFGLGDRLGEFREWVAAKGALGPVIFVGVYALATVMAIPGSALTIMAGAIFGSVVGVITVIFGATFGASLCFLISRYFARDFVASLLAKSEKFKKLDDMTEKNGAIIVAITRLVPLFPFNLLNYGFGLTKVPFLTYVFWSFICMLPGTILYVVGTDAVTTAIQKGEIPWILISIVLLIFVILFLLVKKAKSKIKE